MNWLLIIVCVLLLISGGIIYKVAAHFEHKRNKKWLAERDAVRKSYIAEHMEKNGDAPIPPPVRVVSEVHGEIKTTPDSVLKAEVMAAKRAKPASPKSVVSIPPMTKEERRKYKADQRAQEEAERNRSFLDTQDHTIHSQLAQFHSPSLLDTAYASSSADRSFGGGESVGGGASGSWSSDSSSSSSESSSGSCGGGGGGD